MSTIVYQELQPYNNESTTLSLKLSSPKDTISQTHPLSSNFEYDSKITPSSNCISQPSPAATHYGPIEMRSSSCSWSEIEALTTKRKNPIDEQVYVHPLVKKSSFKLSEKSLEMCTESLGSETGCCVMESSDFFQSIMSMKETRKPLTKLAKREELVLDQGNFPPPLTTLRGSNPLHVRPVREDGRLVIEAVRSTPIHSYMHAERSDGRLKLSFVRDCRSSEHEDDNCDLQISGNEGFEEGEESLERNVEEGEENENNEGECVIISDEYMLDELKGVTMEFEVRLGLEKVQRRPRGCKERGQRSRRLINWEPFWVAT